MPQSTADTALPRKAHRREVAAGAALLVVGALLLAGGLGASASGSITAPSAEVTATAEQRRDFVPIVRVATVRAERRHDDR